MSNQLQPPVAKKVSHLREFHGKVFQDNYEWMRDKDSEELRAHLEAENAYTEARTGHLKDLTEDIFQEVKARVQETDMSLPVRNGDWWYFSRTQEGKSYASMCRIKATGSVDSKDVADWTPPTIDPAIPHPDEQVFLDCNALAEGHEFFSLGAASISTNGNLVAYSVDYDGDERFSLRVKDLTTGELLEDRIDDIFYGATWVGDDTIYYQKVDEAWRPHEVWCHIVGTPTEQDQLVYREDDERFWTSVATTRSERFLLIHAASKVTSEVWFKDLKDPAAQLQCVVPREENVEYGVDHAVVGGEDMWLIVHNKHGVNSELAYHPAGALQSLEDATTLVAHRDDARVDGVDVFANHVVLEFRENAIERVFLMALNTNATGAEAFTDFEEITFEEDLASVGTAGNSEWDAPVLRVAVSSFTTPARVFDVDLRTGERLLRKEQVVLPGPDGREFNSADYSAQRLWVTSRDGVQIPVSVIHRSDVDITKNNPVLLYAYGSYEACMDPSFSVFRLSMLDRGVVYVIAHIRGGGEMGRTWYDTGKGLFKKNTFNDYVDVADFLISRGMTSADRVVAEGGSAGGMLMGAVANMAGDRFAGIQAVVPFVDPLTSMLMPDLPLTVTEWDEWGDPFHDAEVYDYMASYAPYENISADKVYPPILAITSINDTRVLYVEPAKWVAKLREVAGADALLKCELSGGHGGVSGRYEKWRQAAFETAWELDRMGASQPVV